MRSSTRRHGSATRVALALVSLCATAACSGAADAPPSPADALDAYITAYNADDLDAVMALFDDGATVANHPLGPPTATGSASIRNLHRSDRAMASVDDPYTVSDVDVDGDTVTWNHRWVSRDEVAWCADGHEMIVRDGMIVEWTFAPNPHECL